MMTCSRLWVVSHDQFTIGRQIGRGAWAAVHATTFRGAIIAAKYLHQLITSPKTRELFQREMEMALHCQHQNIVTFLGATKLILFKLVDDLKAQVQQQFPQYHQLVTSCTNHQSSNRPTMYDIIEQLDRIKAARP